MLRLHLTTIFHFQLYAYNNIEPMNSRMHSLPDMAFSSCLQPSFKSSVATNQHFSLAFKSHGAEQFKSGRGSLHGDWSSIKGSRFITRPKHATSLLPRRGPAIRASWLSNSQIASSAFTLGTVAVLPFYTLMIVAPKAKLTKMSMDSSMPYMVLGIVYAYLLYLSWTPATIRAMFASKYLLPELPGMVHLFSSEMTLASAWIHLLGIDLFAARQIFHDGLENGIETRHSVSLCLLSCPVGILSHFITKALTKSSSNSEHDM